VKLTLKGCEHKALEAWGNPPANRRGRSEFYATCLNCYERLVFSDPTWDGRGALNLAVEPAPPPALCPHPNRKPVAAQITKNMPYRDAICTGCGVIQRHPDGRGVWTDVVFYGYLIEEEP
jgi:hypothetical protein